MAVCSLDKNLLRTTSCGYSLPQIVTLYVANFADVKTVDLTEPSKD